MTIALLAALAAAAPVPKDEEPPVRVVLVTTANCVHCEKFKPEFDKLAAGHASRVVAFSIDDSKNIPAWFKVESVPTVLVITKQAATVFPGANAGVAPLIVKALNHPTPETFKAIDAEIAANNAKAKAAQPGGCRPCEVPQLMPAP